MRKIISAILALFLLLHAMPVLAVEKSAELAEDSIIKIMRSLEIMQGDYYGNLHLDDNVTRAEFVKMAVAASAHKDDANVKISYSVFPDVSPDFWGAGYIRTAVDAGWIKGYLDGTFKPNGNVKLEEAVTIMLKLLGYTDTDFIGFYPEGQLAKYTSLKMDTGISAVRGQQLTRRECMYLIYNTLCTYTKNGTPYCQSLGYAADADGNIDYNALTKDDKKGPFVVTDVSAWQQKTGVNNSYTVYKNGKSINIADVEKHNVIYTSPEFRYAWVYDESITGTVDAFEYTDGDLCAITVSGTPYTVDLPENYNGDLSENVLEKGDIITALLGENKTVVEAYRRATPYIVTDISKWQTETSITDEFEIYKDGKLIKCADIEISNVIYYEPAHLTATVYDTVDFGTIEKIVYTDDEVSAITLSGTQYNVIPKEQYCGKLAQGYFEEDDYVAVVLGENGWVVEAYGMDAPKTVSGVSALSPVPQIIYKNGAEATSASITEKSLVYNCPDLSLAYFYDTDVTGIIAEISPSVDDPKTVVLNPSSSSSGGSYTLGENAKKLFVSDTAFKEKDFVTLHIGKNNIVELVEYADAFDTDIYEDMGISYETIVAQSVKGPEIVTGSTWKEKLGFPADSARYLLDGKQVESYVISDYDVLYYSYTLKTVWIVSDKVTGVLEDILPNSMTPSSIKVAGTEYPLETNQATLSFAGLGQFRKGDSLTLILGASGVVAAVDPQLASTEFIGLSTDVYKKEYKDASGNTLEDYFVSVQSFDGKVHEILTGNKNIDKNKLVIVTRSGDKTVVKELGAKYNDITEVTTAIKNGNISPNAVLVDCYGKNYAHTFAARLSEIKITADKVLYYRLNSSGQLDYLVLDDATGDIHSYGIVTQNVTYKGDQKIGSSYNFFTSSKNNSISNYVSAPTGIVQIKYNNVGEADKITALTEQTVTTIDGSTVRHQGNTSKLWDYAECYVIDHRTYKLALDDDEKPNDYVYSVSLDRIKTLLDSDEYTVKCGFDSTRTVRVLVAMKK